MNSDSDEMVRRLFGEAAKSVSSGPLPHDPKGPPPIALVGATIHPIGAPVVQRGSLLMQGERILAVGTDLVLPPGTPPPRFDPRLAALALYAAGTKRVALHADKAQTILFALEFAREEALDAVLFGATEGWRIAWEASSRASSPMWS